MICPYRLKRYVTTTMIRYEEITEGTAQETGSMVLVKYENEECPKKQCGAWHRGKCRYKN